MSGTSSSSTATVAPAGGNNIRLADVATFGLFEHGKSNFTHWFGKNKSALDAYEIKDLVEEAIKTKKKAESTDPKIQQKLKNFVAHVDGKLDETSFAVAHRNNTHDIAGMYRNLVKKYLGITEDDERQYWIAEWLTTEQTTRGSYDDHVITKDEIFYSHLGGDVKIDELHRMASHRTARPELRKAIAPTVASIKVEDLEGLREALSNIDRNLAGENGTDRNVSSDVMFTAGSTPSPFAGQGKEEAKPVTAKEVVQIVRAEHKKYNKKTTSAPPRRHFPQQSKELMALKEKVRLLEGKGGRKQFTPRTPPNSVQQNVRLCWNCKQPGHQKHECTNPKVV